MTPPDAPPNERETALRPAGWRVVARKELADHLRSARFALLALLVGLTAAATVSAAAAGIREEAPELAGRPALFLGLFTTAPEGLFAFFALLGFLAPLLGIAFGFDAVNGERARGTLPRLLAQPIHRDDVINGKFGAGLAVITAFLAALVLVVSGIGLVRLAIVPSAGEIARVVAFLAITILHVAVWLAFATLCSVLFRRAATSALTAIAVWLVLTCSGRSSSISSPTRLRPLARRRRSRRSSGVPRSGRTSHGCPRPSSTRRRRSPC